MRLDLEELLHKHASDKHSQNGYGPIYHALFKHLRDAHVYLLEIGIGTVLPNVPSSMIGHNLPGYRPGASLRAWRDYFTDARIFGIDTQIDTQLVNEERIATAICDSTNPIDVRRFVASLPPAPAFDIIIDDGSHIAEHQLATLRNFYPYLGNNGLYIIEDVNRTDLNQSRLPLDHAHAIEQILGGEALYFTVSCPKADMLIISRRETVGHL